MYEFRSVWFACRILNGIVAATDAYYIVTYSLQYKCGGKLPNAVGLIISCLTCSPVCVALFVCYVCVCRVANERGRANGWPKRYIVLSGG